MGKKLWKQIISLMLAVAMVGTAVVPARAEEKGLSTPFNSFYSDENSLEKLFNKESGYAVTEEEVSEFEKEYEAEQSKLVRPMEEGNSTVAEFARKKAAVLTALYGLDSVQYALIEDGEITVSGSAGYADKANKKEPKESTMYGIASISKIFTTTAVLQLVEEGKVNLDEPVTTYITDFEMADERYKDITVRMLLNHSSGILGGSLNNALLFDDNDTANHDNLLKALKAQRLKADPGDYSVYCNDGFTLAEILVERVTGQTFTEYVAENITGPLKLTGTKTPQDTFKTTKLAGIYDGKAKLPIENFNTIGTGGFYSTASNLCKFAEVFMDGSTQTEVLSGQSAAAMAVRASQGNSWLTLNSRTDGYGLGWDSVNAYPFDQYGIKALTKGGDSAYYHGSLVVLPGEKKAVAVLSSSGSSTIDQIFGSAILMQALYEDGRILELPESSPSYGKPEKQAVPEELMKYEGYYVTLGDIYKIKLDSAGTLFLNSIYEEKNKVQLVYTGNGRFRDAAGNSEFRFVTEGNGETYLWGGSYATLPGIGTYFGEYYQLQKIEDNPLSKEVKAVWEARKDKSYFIINEKYSSVIYTSGGLFSDLVFPEEVEGYVGYSKIIDENTAITDILLPDVIGRDLTDFKFYTKNGIEYVKINDYVAVSEEGVKTLSSKSKYKLTVGSDGYAKWYKIGSKTAGKVMSVTVPENGSFAVYDKDGNCKTHSYVSGKTKITLPKGGYVVFIGDAKAKFTVKITKKK